MCFWFWLNCGLIKKTHAVCGSEPCIIFSGASAAHQSEFSFGSWIIPRRMIIQLLTQNNAAVKARACACGSIYGDYGSLLEQLTTPLQLTSPQVSQIQSSLIISFQINCSSFRFPPFCDQDGGTEENQWRNIKPDISSHVAPEGEKAIKTQNSKFTVKNRTKKTVLSLKYKSVIKRQRFQLPFCGEKSTMRNLRGEKLILRQKSESWVKN